MTLDQIRVKVGTLRFAVGIDIGGTFTDAVVVDDEGRVESYKTPTTPGRLVEGLLEDVALAAGAAGLDVRGFLERVDHLAHGTTAATNAYLERRGARTGLLATRGFEDVVFQQRMMGMTAGLSRSEVTDYARRSPPEPLAHPRLVHGIRERVDYRGRVLCPLVDDDVARAAAALAEDGVEAVAICFLWSFKNPAHERRAAALVRDLLPDTYVSVSSELAPRIGEYERTATTLVNAYLGPAIARYTESLEARLAEGGSRAKVRLLDSSGGAIAPRDAGAQPVRLLLSGPSGGLTACEQLGRRLGHPNVITFDMGGTSADVGLIVDGVHLRRRDTVAGKYHLLLPMADIQSLGAGGGSIARVEPGGYLRVGPVSAGAEPGPVCYGRGGTEPTVTDADLVLGILDPENFLGGRLRLDVEAAERAIEARIGEPLGLSTLEAAAGIKRIVDARMADLLRTVTIRRGHDPRRFVLYAFGGAGPAHAPAFGLDLVDAIVVPATQAVHSALGALASDLFFSFELSEPMRWAAVDAARVREIYAGLEGRARSALDEHGVPSAGRLVERFVEMRFTRQTKELRIAVPDGQLDERPLAGIAAAFEQRYADLYGTESVPESAGLELVTFSVDARGSVGRHELARHPRSGPDASHALRGTRSVWDPAARALVETPVFEGPALRPEHRIAGPAVIEYPGSTVAVAGRQEAIIDEFRDVVVGRAG